VINVMTAVITAQKDQLSMTIFTITPDNNITAYTSAAEANSNPEAEQFGTAEQLTRLAQDWPASRLVDIWNTLPGHKPVKKFTDQKTAIRRLWTALQALLPEPDAQTPTEATSPVGPEHGGTPRKKPAAGGHGRKVAQVPSWPTQPCEATPNELPSATGLPEPGAQPPLAATSAPLQSDNATPPEKPATARQGSKTAQVLDLLKQPGGATLNDIMSATGWQAHSVRGFLSGALGKKMGIAVESAKRPDGERAYSITQKP
jgi:hypothetical protein